MIKLDMRQLSRGYSEKVGSHLEFRLSAYDIPQAVSCSSPEPGKLRIKFLYLDNEDAVPSTAQEGVEIFVGKHSGKILYIDIAAGTTMESVRVIIAQKTEAMSSGSPRMNHQLIGDVVAEHAEELMPT